MNHSFEGNLFKYFDCSNAAILITVWLLNKKSVHLIIKKLWEKVQSFSLKFLCNYYFLPWLCLLYGNFFWNKEKTCFSSFSLKKCCFHIFLTLKYIECVIGKKYNREKWISIKNSFNHQNCSNRNTKLKTLQHFLEI